MWFLLNSSLEIKLSHPPGELYTFIQSTREHTWEIVGGRMSRRIIQLLISYKLEIISSLSLSILRNSVKIAWRINSRYKNLIDWTTAWRGTTWSINARRASYDPWFRNFHSIPMSNIVAENNLLSTSMLSLLFLWSILPTEEKRRQWIIYLNKNTWIFIHSLKNAFVSLLPLQVMFVRPLVDWGTESPRWHSHPKRSLLMLFRWVSLHLHFYCDVCAYFCT